MPFGATLNLHPGAASSSAPPTEQDVLPNDPTGNRRFVPITLNAATQAVEGYLARHRDQLWAEALARHSAGVTPRLPRTLMPHAAVAAETHRNRDIMIEDALDAALPPDWEGTLEASRAQDRASRRA